MLHAGWKTSTQMSWCQWEILQTMKRESQRWDENSIFNELKTDFNVSKNVMNATGYFNPSDLSVLLMFRFSLFYSAFPCNKSQNIVRNWCISFIFLAVTILLLIGHGKPSIETSENWHFKTWNTPLFLTLTDWLIPEFRVSPELISREFS